MDSEKDHAAEPQDIESRPQSLQPAPPTTTQEHGEGRSETCSQQHREEYDEDMKFEDLSQQNKSLQEQNNQLEDQVALLQEKLDQYDADRLDDEPEEPITDRSANIAYQDILHAIEQWIYSVTANPKVPPWKDNSYEYRKQIKARICQTVPAEEFVNYDFAEFFLLTRVILQLLHTEIFQRSLPIGLSPRQMDVLDQAMHGMSADGGSRDASRVHKWKVQACEALMRHEGFADNLRSEIGRICDSFGKELKYWLASSKDFDKHRDALVDEVIIEAVHLQHKLSLSAHAYRFHLTDPQPRKAFDSSLLNCELRDVDTWRQPDNNNIDDGDSELLPTVLGELSPRLMRDGPENETFLVIKPIMVIATSHTSEKARTERTLGSQGIHATVEKRWSVRNKTWPYRRTPNASGSGPTRGKWV